MAASGDAIEIARRIISAIFQAETQNGAVGAIRMDSVRKAITLVAAAMIEGNPSVESEADIREVSLIVGSQISDAALTLRQQYLEDGQRLWPGRPIRLS